MKGIGPPLVNLTNATEEWAKIYEPHLLIILKKFPEYQFQLGRRLNKLFEWYHQKRYMYKEETQRMVRREGLHSLSVFTHSRHEIDTMYLNATEKSWIMSQYYSLYNLYCIASKEEQVLWILRIKCLFDVLVNPVAPRKKFLPQRPLRSSAIQLNELNPWGLANSDISTIKRNGRARSNSWEVHTSNSDFATSKKNDLAVDNNWGVSNSDFAINKKSDVTSSISWGVPSSELTSGTSWELPNSDFATNTKSSLTVNNSWGLSNSDFATTKKNDLINNNSQLAIFPNSNFGSTKKNGNNPWGAVSSKLDFATTKLNNSSSDKDIKLISGCAISPEIISESSLNLPKSDILNLSSLDSIPNSFSKRKEIGDTSNEELKDANNTKIIKNNDLILKDNGVFQMGQIGDVPNERSKLNLPIKIINDIPSIIFIKVVFYSNILEIQTSFDTSSDLKKKEKGMQLHKIHGDDRNGKALNVHIIEKSDNGDGDIRKNINSSRHDTVKQKQRDLIRGANCIVYILIFVGILILARMRDAKERYNSTLKHLEAQKLEKNDSSVDEEIIRIKKKLERTQENFEVDLDYASQRFFNYQKELLSELNSANIKITNSQLNELSNNFFKVQSKFVSVTDTLTTELKYTADECSTIKNLLKEKEIDNSIFVAFVKQQMSILERQNVTLTKNNNEINEENSKLKEELAKLKGDFDNMRDNFKLSMQKQELNVKKIELKLEKKFNDLEKLKNAFISETESKIGQVEKLKKPFVVLVDKVLDLEKKFLSKRNLCECDLNLNLEENSKRVKVSISWQVHDSLNQNLIHRKSFIVHPEGKFRVPHHAVKIHGITTEKATVEGKKMQYILEELYKDLEDVTVAVAHNFIFDNKVVLLELERFILRNLFLDLHQKWTNLDSYCTMRESRKKVGKVMKLKDLHKYLFENRVVEENKLHTSGYDTELCSEIYFELQKPKAREPEPIGIIYTPLGSAPKIPKPEPIGVIYTPLGSAPKIPEPEPIGVIYTPLGSAPKIQEPEPIRIIYTPLGSAPKIPEPEPIGIIYTPLGSAPRIQEPIKSIKIGNMSPSNHKKITAEDDLISILGKLTMDEEEPSLPLCFCKNTSILRRGLKDRRYYYVCANNGQTVNWPKCKFFQFRDESDQKKYLKKIWPIYSNKTEPECNCTHYNPRKKARFVVTTSIHSPLLGRPYFSCWECNFFQWIPNYNLY
ncbi:hypothetical protein HDU92_006341 [Lobulomyces angularis]|nr:hypothetical protein HDU92_006341 [Lobulomyces angularis]